MRFVASDGSFLELSIVGYEFPELERVPYDSNWLFIAGHAASACREWEFREPCLLTYEVAALAEWLEARSKDVSKGSDIQFIEPHLYFRWNHGVLEVQLDLECLPPWVPKFRGQEFFLRSHPLGTNWPALRCR